MFFGLPVYELLCNNIPGSIFASTMRSLASSGSQVWLTATRPNISDLTGFCPPSTKVNQRLYKIQIYFVHVKYRSILCTPEYIKYGFNLFTRVQLENIDLFCIQKITKNIDFFAPLIMYHSDLFHAPTFWLSIYLFKQLPQRLCKILIYFGYER